MGGCAYVNVGACARSPPFLTYPLEWAVCPSQWPVCPFRWAVPRPVPPASRWPPHGARPPVAYAPTARDTV
ncbi:hypothetical protein Sm713_21750 [Streptomyces sp. TS71-3]|nr:hypothetical protein Sm713_21750 [Streptomyces sp. TS71-3]